MQDARPDGKPEFCGETGKPGTAFAQPSSGSDAAVSAQGLAAGATFVDVDTPKWRIRLYVAVAVTRDRCS